ncbi:MAG: hypothetical protein ACOX0R_02725 [Candidatus Dojkabacteria bacterium]
MNKEQEVKNKSEKVVSQTAKEVKPKKQEDTFIADHDSSINLIPIMSRSEVVAEKKKVKLNISAIVSIIVFLVITISIVVFTTVSKIQVDNAKTNLSKQEQDMKQFSSKILSNNEILKRIYLYNDIESNQYSPKIIFDYFSNIASFDQNIHLDRFIFRSDTSLDFEGKGNTLDTVSRFWYLLTEDEKVDNAILDSISKLDDSVRFSFKVTMKEGAFNTKSLENKNDTTNE